MGKLADAVGPDPWGLKLPPVDQNVTWFRIRSVLPFLLGMQILQLRPGSGSLGLSC